jgi:hypothetical protein
MNDKPDYRPAQEALYDILVRIQEWKKEQAQKAAKRSRKRKAGPAPNPKKKRPKRTDKK